MKKWKSFGFFTPQVKKVYPILREEGGIFANFLVFFVINPFRKRIFILNQFDFELNFFTKATENLKLLRQ